MQESAPSGVADGTSRDDAGASRTTVEPNRFWTDEQLIPAAHGDGKTAVQIYSSGEGQFAVQLGPSHATLMVWTTEEGLEALVGLCLRALDRARFGAE